METVKRKLGFMFRVVLALVFISLPVQAGSSKLGFISGKDYQLLTQRQKQNWAVGVVDGILAKEYWKKYKENSGKSPDGAMRRYWLSKCVNLYPLDKLIALFESELKRKPKEWGKPAAIIFYKKVSDFCRRNK